MLVSMTLPAWAGSSEDPGSAPLPRLSTLCACAGSAASNRSASANRFM
jgi:hypothetical protein